MGKKTKRNIRYEANKKAKVGEELICPICGSKFVKRTYSNAFCDSKCKDAFWNAKKDRHSAGYYERYDSKHPERKVRRALYSMNVVNSRDAAELDARVALATDDDFKRYVKNNCGDNGAPDCAVDLSTMYENFLILACPGMD